MPTNKISSGEKQPHANLAVGRQGRSPHVVFQVCKGVFYEKNNHPVGKFRMRPTGKWAVTKFTKQYVKELTQIFPGCEVKFTNAFVVAK